MLSLLFRRRGPHFTRCELMLSSTSTAIVRIALRLLCGIVLDCTRSSSHTCARHIDMLANVCSGQIQKEVSRKDVTISCLPSPACFKNCGGPDVERVSAAPNTRDGHGCRCGASLILPATWARGDVLHHRGMARREARGLGAGVQVYCAGSACDGRRCSCHGVC